VSILTKVFAKDFQILILCLSRKSSNTK